MSFVTLPFFLFVAALTLVYFLVPGKYQWLVLLLGSYVFYWTHSRWLALVLVGTSLATYGIALWLQRINDRGKAYLKQHAAELSREEKKARKEKTKKAARGVLLLGIAVDLGALLFLKYFNFFAANINSLLVRFGGAGSVPMLSLLLPLGISFYTLQAIAYMVDVYRGKEQADKNPLKFMLFMSFFPQIVQGPIPRHDQLAHQLYAPHRFDYTRMCYGVQMMLWGLIKKLSIAERLTGPVNYLFTHSARQMGPLNLFAAILYSFQIYTDFSGGMDIGRGVAQILGIELELNFRQPYFSGSIEEFWRRWHMTMGKWMKDYVFYPLSLSKAFTSLGRTSRKLLGQFIGKRLPAFIAMFIAYLAVGFWHGPNWKYVAYGIWNGLFIMSGILLDGVYAKCRDGLKINEQAVTWRVFRILRTFLIVSIGRFFSRSDSLADALTMGRNMFTRWTDITFLTNGTLLNIGLDTAEWVVLCIFLLVLFYVDFQHEKQVSFRAVIARQPLVFRWIIYIGAVLLLLIFGCYGPVYNAADFIYAGF